MKKAREETQIDRVAATVQNYDQCNHVKLIFWAPLLAAPLYVTRTNMPRKPWLAASTKTEGAAE